MKADDIRRIAAAHKASNVAVFGSVARGEDTPESDVDLLVDAGPRMDLLDLCDLQDELSAFLGSPVDVITRGGLKERDDHIRREAVAL